MKINDPFNRLNLVQFRLFHPNFDPFKSIEIPTIQGAA
jgi:hypothetical protein